MNVGIETNRSDSDNSYVVLYPNPNNGIFKLLFLKEFQDASITVYSVDGKKVYNETLPDGSAGEEVSFNLQHLRKGIYIVSVKDKNISKGFRLAIQ